MVRVLTSLLSVFENTIRFVGGFLSAFELSGNQHQILVEKAKELADQLAFAWVGVSPCCGAFIQIAQSCLQDNDIPFGHLDFSTTPPTPMIDTVSNSETFRNVMDDVNLAVVEHRRSRISKCKLQLTFVLCFDWKPSLTWNGLRFREYSSSKFTEVLLMSGIQEIYWQ